MRQLRISIPRDCAAHDGDAAQGQAQIGPLASARLHGSGPFNSIFWRGWHAPKHRVARRDETMCSAVPAVALTRNEYYLSKHLEGLLSLYQQERNRIEMDGATAMQIDGRIEELTAGPESENS